MTTGQKRKTPRRTTRRKKTKSTVARRLLPFLAVAAVALVLVLWFLLGRGGRGLAPGGETDFGDRVRVLAESRGCTSSDIAADDPIRKVGGVFVRSWRIGVPSDAAVDGLRADLMAEAGAWRAGVEEEAGPGSDQVRLRIDLGIEAFEVELRTSPPRVRADLRPTPKPRRRPTATPRPEPPPRARGRLAVILDDGGQSLDLVTAAAALPREVAVSILPFLPHSVETAAELHRSGHEVWLHLPMEPVGYPESNPGVGAVLTAMTDGEIRATVHSALNSVPHAVGVNNHMGSRATADLRTMTWVMQELKARGMAFIDSRTTVDTVAEQAARAQGVPTGRRHVFLDNERTRRAVKRQLEEAVYHCRMHREAVAIGHLTRVTVEVLEEELPQLKQRGADLVPPTELLE